MPGTSRYSLIFRIECQYDLALFDLPKQAFPVVGNNCDVIHRVLCSHIPAAEWSGDDVSVGRTGWACLIDFVIVADDDAAVDVPADVDVDIALVNAPAVLGAH